MMATIVEVIKERAITVLFTEHDMDVVFSLAQIITVMSHGFVARSTVGFLVTRTSGR